MSGAALDMMWGLRMEDGRRWGEVAADFQKEDAEAIFDEAPPHRHFLTRARGGSKTTDLAGIAVSWLAAEAPPLGTGRIVAASSEQAGRLIDAAHLFQLHTPELESAIQVETKKIIGPNGASVEVLTQSDTSSWGLLPHLLICDEFAQWPNSTAAKRVWTAVRTSQHKVPGCRLIILTSAGEPGHWSYTDVYEKNIGRSDWRFHAVLGPPPWVSEDEIEKLRYELMPSVFQRLVMNEWTQDEDSAIYEEDYDAAKVPCVRTSWQPALERYGKEASGYSLSAPVPGQKYVITVDVGISEDAAVMVVAHKEPLDGSVLGPQRVVIDHLERWKGSKKNPIQVSDIEDWVALNAPWWGHADVHADPAQFRGSVQNLIARGVRAKEWPFTSTSVGEVASALVQTFRNRQIHVPDNPILKDELLKVKLRSASAGVTRLDHASGGHDDQAVAIGMACRILIGNGPGVGHAWIEYMRRARQEAIDHPTPPAEQRSLRSYFMSGTEAQPPPRRCPAGSHRYFGLEHVCANCGATPEVA